MSQYFRYDDLFFHCILFLGYLVVGPLIRPSENSRLCFQLCGVIILINISAIFQSAERMSKAEIKYSDSSQHISVIGEIAVNSLGG